MSTEIVNERAVAVARDVLAQMTVAHFRVNFFLDGEARDPAVAEVARRQGDLGEVVDVVRRDCTTCLLGACVLSKAKLYDSIPLRYAFQTSSQKRFGLSRDEVHVMLADVFEKADLVLLETAFELDDMAY